jgi:hypothetical protein
MTCGVLRSSAPNVHASRTPTLWRSLALPTLSVVDNDSIAVVGERQGTLRVWAWQNVVFVSWTGKPSADAAKMLGPITDQILAHVTAEKLSYVHLVPNKLELPDAATRTALIELAQVYGTRTACVAIVLGGVGFWASAMRSFVTGIRVVAPRSIDFRLHAELPELLEWFPEEHARKTGVQLAPTDLLRHLEHVTQGSRL